MEGSGRGPLSDKTRSQAFRVGIHKNHERVRQDSYSPGQDMNPGPSKYVTTHFPDRKHFV